MRLPSLDWDGGLFADGQREPTALTYLRGESLLVDDVLLSPGEEIILFREINFGPSDEFDPDTVIAENGHLRLQISPPPGLRGNPLAAEIAMGLRIPVVHSNDLPVGNAGKSGATPERIARAEFTPVTLSEDAINQAMSAGYNWTRGIAWPYGQGFNVWYNSAGEPSGSYGLSNWSDLSRSGFNAWRPAPTPVWSYTTIATADPYDGKNVVFWRNDGLIGVLATTYSSVSANNPHERTAFDIRINSAYHFWNYPNDAGFALGQVMTHEAGHAYGFGHLYNPMEANGAEAWQDWMGSKNDAHVMYYRHVPLLYYPTWGDKAGANQAYESTFEANVNYFASDILTAVAYTDLNGLGPRNDGLVAEFVDEGGPPYRLSYSSFSPDESLGSCLPQTSICRWEQWWAEEFSYPAGLAISVTDLDSNPRPDVVIHWLTDDLGGNTIHFRVLHNVNTWGKPESVGAYTSNGGGFGFSNQGLATCYTQLDTDSRPDLVEAWIDDPAGSNTIYYRVALNVGSGAGFWSNSIALATIGWDTPGLGLICTETDRISYAPELIFAWMDDPQGANSIHYRILRDATAGGSGTIQDRTPPRSVLSLPPEARSLSATVQDYNAAGDIDLAFYYLDGEGLRGAAELESRLDSHE